MRKKIIFMLAVGALLLTAACGKRTAGNEVPAETKDNRAQPTGTESNDSDTGGIVIGRDVKLTADNPINYSFANVSVHDPSIVEDNGTYYIFGSHLAAAKSKDLMNWELIGSGVNASNPIIPNALEEMREAFEWSKTNTFWLLT